MIHCAGSRVHTDGLHAVQLHTDSATGSVPKHGEMQGPHTEGPCNRGSMQQRVHATEGPCNVPCQASAHACTARALASPALASPVLTACARLHTHILRSAHLHPQPHTHAFGASWRVAVADTCHVPGQASAHACTARALASPALASPVLIACARLHAHILRSAHLHPHPHTARLPLKGTKTSSNTATARSMRSRRKIPRPSGR